MAVQVQITERNHEGGMPVRFDRPDPYGQREILLRRAAIDPNVMFFRKNQAPVVFIHQAPEGRSFDHGLADFIDKTGEAREKDMHGLPGPVQMSQAFIVFRYPPYLYLLLGDDP